MKHLIKLPLFFLFIFISNIYGQDYFEGELKYKIEYKSLSPSISTNFLETEFGNSFSAYVKEDRYAMIYHAKGKQGWMKIIVRLDKGYSYTEFEKSDTITKSKFGNEKDKLLEIKRNSDNKKEILGEYCESITIKYEPTDPKSFFQSFKGRYYFNPKYRLNSKLYKNYTDGFWNLFVQESESISIRNEAEFFPLFKSIAEAISIEQKEISFEMFEPNTSKMIFEKK